MRRPGFTLVELMVVIVIIGLAASAVVLALPDSGPSLGREAERFAARARAAREGAIVEARASAIELVPGGYRTLSRAGGEWRETGRHGWEPGTAARAAPEARIRFDPTGPADPLRLTLTREERTAAVSIASDGTIRVTR